MLSRTVLGAGRVVPSGGCLTCVSPRIWGPPLQDDPRNLGREDLIQQAWGSQYQRVDPGVRLGCPTLVPRLNR